VLTSGLIKRGWLLTILSLLCAFYVQAQPHVLLTDTANLYRVDKYVEVFVDSTNSLALPQLLAAPEKFRFLPTHGNLTFGYTPHTLWLRITSRQITKAQWYLEIPAPFLEYLDFYQQKAGTWSHSVSGYYLPQSARQISHTGHVVPLYFSADSLNATYIKIAGVSPKTFPIFILEKEKFFNKVRLEDIGYGVFFGILTVMFFYNLFIFLSLRQVTYLLYICTIICTFFIFASASGYAGKFLWPEAPWLNLYFGRLLLSLLTVFVAIFTIRFLEVQKYSKTMYYMLWSLVPLAFVAALLMVTETVSSAVNNHASLSTIIYISSGIVCRIKGNKNANYFIAAWTVYLMGGLLITLRNSGVLDFNFWTTHFVEIGAALETTLIAFALADRYRKLKQEKEEAQALALALQQNANEKLESKVAERTEQLSRANLELSVTLETVRQQSKIIELKNAELDGFFYRISHDLKGPISSLQGLYNLAKMEVRDEPALAYIERKHQQVLRLNTIINGLIHLTKLSDTTLPKEKIDFHKMIDDCIASFDELENSKNIEFRKQIDTSLHFYSEWTLLNAIVQNLIENAIKYSRREAPFIEVSVSSDDASVRLVVKDNGLGIPAANQSKIFDMFYRATHNAAGTGLGLYILKRSVDRLQGTVQVESEEGAGSTFTVLLPK
jgi:signal transduction histidine kinase